MESTLTFCKRKRTRAFPQFVNDSTDARLTFPAADELHFYSAGATSPRKKHKANDSLKFHQNDDDASDGTYADEEHMLGNGNLSECHTDSHTVQQTDCAQLTFTSNQPHDSEQSSNFEDLLLGLIAENECSRTASNAVDVESNNKCAHTTEVYTSSDSDISDNDSPHDANQSDINKQCSVDGNNADLEGPSSFFHAGVLKDCSSLSDAPNELQIVNAQSVDNKTEVLKSKKKHSKDKKPEKWTPDCSKSEYHKRTQKEMFPDNRNYYALLRKLHRPMNMHGDVCAKMSKQRTAETGSEKQRNNCEKHPVTKAGNQYNMSSRHCTESVSTESTSPKTKSNKMTREHTSLSVCSSISNAASSSLVMHDCVDTQNTVVTESSAQTAGVVLHDSSEDVLLEKDLPVASSTVLSEDKSMREVPEEGQFERLLLDVLVADKSPHREYSFREDLAISRSERQHEFALSECTTDDESDDPDTCPMDKQSPSQPTSSQTDIPVCKQNLYTDEMKNNEIRSSANESQSTKSHDSSACSSDGSPSLLDSTLLQWFLHNDQTPVGLRDTSAPRPIDDTADGMV